jgi:DHA1 family multidrug resistance protein-like MFS transporter
MQGQKNNWQMIYLSICSFAILFVGMGLFPLLPIYAGSLGAPTTVIGIFLALTSVSLTVGTLLTNSMVSRFSRKTTFVAAGMAGALALFALGFATELWQVILLTCLVWFTGGIGTALVNVYIGLRVSERDRGKWFSRMALTLPVAAIIGGLVVGRLVEWWGYPLMFLLIAAEYAIWPVIGLWKIEEVQAPKAQKTKRAKTTEVQSGRGFQLLLLAALLAAVPVSVNRLGLSLVMDENAFSPAAITGTNVFGGLVTIPVVLWFGVLSDRLGRRFLLILGYVIAASGSLFLIFASDLWHFWFITLSMLISRSITGSLSSALASDILAPHDLDRYLPRLSSMAWIAGVLGFVGSGYLLETLGRGTLFMIVTLLPLVASLLLGVLPGKQPELAPANRVRTELNYEQCAADAMC